MAFKELIEDLQIKTKLADVDELKRFEEIYNQLNPGQAERWNELFLELCATTDTERRNRIIDRMYRNPYYNAVGKDLIIAQTRLAAMRNIKSTRFEKN